MATGGISITDRLNKKDFFVIGKNSRILFGEFDDLVSEVVKGEYVRKRLRPGEYSVEFMYLASKPLLSIHLAFKKKKNLTGDDKALFDLVNSSVDLELLSVCDFSVIPSNAGLVKQINRFKRLRAGARRKKLERLFGRPEREIANGARIYNGDMITYSFNSDVCFHSLGHPSSKPSGFAWGGISGIFLVVHFNQKLVARKAIFNGMFQRK